MCFEQILGGGKTPPVVQQSPIADQAKIDAEAAAKAASARTARGRRMRASSLLATSGSGDPNDPVTGQAIASPGKPVTGG